MRVPRTTPARWPSRTDTHLRAGTAEQDVERWVQSASLLHSNGDAMDIAVREGRIVGVRGRAAGRVNRKRPGPKDLYGWQANSPGPWSVSTVGWWSPLTKILAPQLLTRV